MEIETLQRLRVLALSEMGLAPFMDTSRMVPSEKAKLVNLIQTKHDIMKREEIIADFNTLVTKKIIYPGAPLEKYKILL